jgi:anaerobic selenocysteine-containing dehydrogenase
LKVSNSAVAGGLEKRGVAYVGRAERANLPTRDHAGRAFCDDCLSSILKVRPRQQIQQKTSKLAKSPLERFAAPQDPIEMVTLSSTRIASEYCQVSVGGDVAALEGIMKVVIEAHDTAVEIGGETVLDVAFIEQHTHGFSAFAEDLRRTDWDDILRVSGLSREQINRVARIYTKATAVIVCYGMGITQHRHGSENVQQLVNLLLLRGNFGKPGAGSTSRIRIRQSRYPSGPGEMRADGLG